MDITVEELAAYLQTTIATDDPSANLYVDLANGMVDELVPDDLSPIPIRVKAITLEVAARAWRNPKGTSSQTRSFDDSSKTERWEGHSGTTGVFLTDQERDELLQLSGTAEAVETIFVGTRWFT